MARGIVSRADAVRHEMAERLQRAESAALSARREGYCAGFEAGKTGRLVCLVMGAGSGMAVMGLAWAVLG